MKRILLFIVLAFAFQSCMFSHSHGCHAYFCTTTPSQEQRFLFIDKHKIGELPYTDEVPECEEMPSEKYAVYAKLSSGEHLVEIKTADGYVLFSEDLEVERSRRGSSISSTVENPNWDTKVKVKDDRLVIELVH